MLACLPDAGMRATALVLVAVLPMAHLGAWMEQRYRKRQNLSYNSLIKWNRRGVSRDYAPHKLVIQSLAELFTLNLVLFLLCTTSLLTVMRLALPWISQGFQPTWPMLWMGACAGAILALRLPRAYVVAGASFVLGAVAFL